MLSEQTLNNMALGELVSYSETLSDVPASLAQLLAKEALEVLSREDEYDDEMGQKDEAIYDMEQELEKMESKLDNLESILFAARKELDNDDPGLDVIRTYLEE